MTLIRHWKSMAVLTILAVSLSLASLVHTGSAALLSPDSVSGLQAWYQVASGVEISGSAVTDWLDSTAGGSNDMAQGNGTYQPSRQSRQPAWWRLTSTVATG